MTVKAVAGIGASQNKCSGWDGIITADHATRRQGRYKQLCASRHGEMLAGGESSPPLAGGEFLSNWNTLTVGDLFDHTRSSMPQSKPGSLSPEAAAEVLAYLLGSNQFLAGKEELPHVREVLKEIRIEATKPERRE